MEYRRLGRAGVKVSVLSFGSWVTFGTQVGEDDAVELMALAHEAGVNFFDNAEAYGGGESERVMGRALAQLGWERKSYLVSTKLFWGIDDGAVNLSNTLNRKYLLQAIDGSLERFGLDFVDLVYCHRADPETPIEEWRAKLPALLADLYRVVSRLGGTLSGEHGIGSKRSAYLPLVMDPALIALQRRIKEVFDPLNILNPGKIFPPKLTTGA